MGAAGDRHSDSSTAFSAIHPEVGGRDSRDGGRDLHSRAFVFKLGRFFSASLYCTRSETLARQGPASPRLIAQGQRAVGLVTWLRTASSSSFQLPKPRASIACHAGDGRASAPLRSGAGPWRCRARRPAPPPIIDAMKP